MSIKVRWLGIIFILSLAIGRYSALAQTAEPPSDNGRYFPQHGHWVSGDFLTYYQSVPNADQIFGYPITEAFYDVSNQRWVQYFDHTRFELFPENPAPLVVKLKPLGDYFYLNPGRELKLPPNFPDCRYFQESGMQVCYAFLDFFEKNGGAAQFGYPISNFEIQDGLIVQYFQLARFEWHPEFPHGQRVRLSDLGLWYFNSVGEDSSRLLAVPPPDSPLLDPIIRLSVRAFPLHAVMPQSGKQTVYVIVQNQNLLPISNAQVRLHIIFPSGKESRLIVPDTTNNMGITQFSFGYEGEPVGIVQIIVNGRFEQFERQSITSFRIWY
jgi:hypothetical protein